jgi:hypothetical protein
MRKPNITVYVKLIHPFDVITSLVSLEHGVYGWENVTSQRDTRSNVGVTSL